MDEATRQALRDMDECQQQLSQVNECLENESYNKLRKLFYDKRASVIDKIPNFWVNAIVNHPQISMLVDEEDCLHFLKKLEVEEFENVENGFRVKFVFDENPFFDNGELVKEFQLGPNTEAKSSSTGIKWKEQMDLSKKQPQIIDTRRKRGLEQKTFFSWFSDNKGPTADNIAKVIRDQLWPNPLEFYLWTANASHSNASKRRKRVPGGSGQSLITRFFPGSLSSPPSQAASLPPLPSHTRSFSAAPSPSSWSPPPSHTASVSPLCPVPTQPRRSRSCHPSRRPTVESMLEGINSSITKLGDDIHTKFLETQQQLQQTQRENLETQELMQAEIRAVLKILQANPAAAEGVSGRIEVAVVSDAGAD